MNTKKPEPGDVLIWLGSNGKGARWEILEDGKIKYLGGGIGDLKIGHSQRNSLIGGGVGADWELVEGFEIWCKEVREKNGLQP